MAIRVQLDRVLVERRMSLTELADRVGVTVANLSILKTGKARAVRFSTLDALCRELDCQPGDLLARLGFPATAQGASRLYRESDFPRICAALAAHVQSVCMVEAA